jgi:hypothetical protein
MQAIDTSRAAVSQGLAAAEGENLQRHPTAAPSAPTSGRTATGVSRPASDQATRGTSAFNNGERRGSTERDQPPAAAGAEPAAPERAAAELAHGAERVVQAVGEALAKADEGEMRAAAAGREEAATAAAEEATRMRQPAAVDRKRVSGEGRAAVAPAAAGAAEREERQQPEVDESARREREREIERVRESGRERERDEGAEAEVVVAETPRAAAGDEGGAAGVGGRRGLGAKLRDVFRSPRGGARRGSGGSLAPAGEPPRAIDPAAPEKLGRRPEERREGERRAPAAAQHPAGDFSPHKTAAQQTATVVPPPPHHAAAPSGPPPVAAVPPHTKGPLTPLEEPGLEPSQQAASHGTSSGDSPPHPPRRAIDLRSAGSGGAAQRDHYPAGAARAAEAEGGFGRGRSAGVERQEQREQVRIDRSFSPLTPNESEDGRRPARPRVWLAPRA